MPLKKLQIAPGVNREHTRYTSEGGWYESNRIRFRQGLPEQIGGWVRASSNTFLGVCRSLFRWAKLGGELLIGVGTHLKFYIQLGGVYHDITPIINTSTASIAATNGSSTITVTDTAHGALEGDYVTFSGATGMGGVVTADVLNANHRIASITSANVYTITLSVTANATDAAGSPDSATSEYEVHIGGDTSSPSVGWGSGTWNSGTWGSSDSTLVSLRIWNQSNFGENLIYGPQGGALYIWKGVLANRGVPITGEAGASNVPTEHNLLLVSDISRFVFVFGTNNLGTSTYDPMLIRWSDQESYVQWTPAATNQAGDLRLSRGSQIVAVKQSRQEILVWTDVALYSLQYLGSPEGWGAQLVGENISIASDRSVAYASGVAFWMGRDKFYAYGGQTTPLPCDLRKFIFNDFNETQYTQIFSGTNEAFHEIWWFYCSDDSSTIDKYVIYNYLEKIWYYGDIDRTAWLDDAISGLPVAASYSNNLVVHEFGIDDNVTGVASPMGSYITSSEFDIDDGHRFAFVWRLLPDITFEGSTAESPSVDMTLSPLRSSGAGYTDPLSTGGESMRSVVRSTTVPVEEYTGQLNIRVRGRQMSIKIESNNTGVNWQLGEPRIDLRPDGRR